MCNLPARRRDCRRSRAELRRPEPASASDAVGKPGPSVLDPSNLMRGIEGLHEPAPLAFGFAGSGNVLKHDRRPERAAVIGGAAGPRKDVGPELGFHIGEPILRPGESHAGAGSALHPDAGEPDVPAAGRRTGTGRRRLWELWSGYHCSICGTCLSIAELSQDRRQGRASPALRRRRIRDPWLFREARGRARARVEVDAEAAGPEVPDRDRALPPDRVGDGTPGILDGIPRQGRRARTVLGADDPPPGLRSPHVACIQRSAHALALGRRLEPDGYPETECAGERAPDVDRGAGRRQAAVVGERSRAPAARRAACGRGANAGEPSQGRARDRRAPGRGRGAHPRIRGGRSVPELAGPERRARGGGAGGSRLHRWSRNAAADGARTRALGAADRPRRRGVDGAGATRGMRRPRTHAAPGPSRNGWRRKRARRVHRSAGTPDRLRRRTHRARHPFPRAHRTVERPVHPTTTAASTTAKGGSPASSGRPTPSCAPWTASATAPAFSPSSSASGRPNPSSRCAAPGSPRS